MRDKGQDYAPVIVLLLFLCMFAVNTGYYQIAGLSTRLMSQMGLSTVQFYAVHSAPMYFSLFLGLVIGTLSGRYGVKRMVSLGLILTCVAYFIRSFVSGYIPLFLCMTLAGSGSAFTNSNSAKIISYWYPEDRISSALGLSLTGMYFALVCGIGFSSLFTTVRAAFLANAVVLAIVTILWIVFFRESPDQTTREDWSRLNGIPMKESLTRAIRSRNVWLLAVCYCCLISCNLIILSFFSAALQARSISEHFSGLITASMAIGCAAGVIGGSRICCRLPRQKPFLLTSAVMLALCSAFAWKLPVVLVPPCLIVLGFCLGSLSSSIQSFPPLLPEIGPRYANGAGGLLVTFQGIGAVIVPTYFIIPLAGGSYDLLFLLTGVLTLPICAGMALLPDVNRPLNRANGTIA